MPATPARIAFVLQPFRRAVATADDTKRRYGNLAREAADPVESCFAEIEDAQQRADERCALLSDDRRSFKVKVADIDERLIAILSADYVPEVRLTDTERHIFDRPMLVSSFAIDTDAQGAEFIIWG